MVEEKAETYERNDFLPIPTYDEAISSRPSSSQSFLGPQEISHDAERQGLLGRGDAQNHRGYRPPTAESVRSSIDDLASLARSSHAGSTEELRRELQQMDIMEPSGDGGARTHLLTSNRLSKRITSLTHSLSSINLPFRQWLPSWDYIKAKAESLSFRGLVDYIKVKVESLSFRGLVVNWIIIFRLIALLMVVFLVYFLFISDLFKLRRTQGRMPSDPELLRAFVKENIQASSIREFSRYLTSYDHMAGTAGGFTQAQFIESILSGSHLEDVGLERFDVYLNFPKENGRKVAIIEPAELAWEAIVEENPAYDDGRNQAPVFHGHSKSGNVTGPLIYANYGSRDDFDYLQKKGVKVSGSVVLTRYGGTESDRALKVRAAKEAGAVGCIIYSDPQESGFVRGPVYPDGRFLPSDGVQRGSVALTSQIFGDVLSPGFPSVPDESRRNPIEDNPALNQIPSIPLAWRDAQKLLQAVKGHGFKLDDRWGKGGVPDVEWWSGDHSAPVVQLQNDQDEVERAPIYNVLGKIIGIEQPDHSIIVGNHHDAWCFGAGDPESGTAVFLEVVRIFGQLRELGWRPLRTIEFASWDGEEYNLIGSTEHVEAHLKDLRLHGAAYINVDVAAVGPDFEASASPVLSTALLHVLERVADPATNKTLRAVFAERGSSIDGLAAGSDYVAFQDLAGTSSLDMTFNGPGYPYHSCYDNFDWMDNFGDPGFTYHRALAEILALLILDLSDRELMPFDFQAYANAVAGYVHDLGDFVAGKAAGKAKGKRHTLDLSPLDRAVELFKENAREFHVWNEEWSNLVFGASGGFESNTLAIKRMSHNARMSNFETNLLFPEGGLRGREQYKHVLFAPHRWDGYGTEYFPSIRDAIEDDDWARAQQEIDKVGEIISYASRKLNN